MKNSFLYQQIQKVYNSHNIKIKEFNKIFFFFLLSLEKNENDIYFHRETIVKSLENRSVDLLTISSYKGISEERECRLFGLFPDENKPRSYNFKNKKVQK